tara:strand:- start:4163 stop:5836 length:1674 start_codon:yes stop_codon:yes gene_type:complete
VALKEMLEAGHKAIAVDKGPGIGGVFCRSHDTQYENLYLTISNMFMAYSDFAPSESNIKYSSKEEYGKYLEDYADHFGLREHIRLNTTVTQATFRDDRWKVTTKTGPSGEESVQEVDALIVASGSSHVANRVEPEGFTGRVLHSSDYNSPSDFAGQKVLLVGSGESAADIASDIAGEAAGVTIWSRSPVSVAPRFPGIFSTDPDHDEQVFMKDETKWGNAKVSDFLEVMTTSRMANAAPMWAYSAVRHAIWGTGKVASPAARRLSAWCRQSVKEDGLRGDQASVPTKNARMCTEAARGNLNVVVAKTATFSGTVVTFPDAIYEGNSDQVYDSPKEAKVTGIDTVLLCTGYKTDFSWLDAPGLDWNPRSWFKQCFPPGLGNHLMFLGWARPHQGGIPSCAEILSRYIAMILNGTRTLPADNAEQAKQDEANANKFYRRAQHSVNLVDYPAFIDSVSKLIGCHPNTPKVTEPKKLLKYWIYPNWSFWYRQNGPGATPKVLEGVLAKFPLRKSFALDPFIILAFLFSMIQLPIGAIIGRRPGMQGLWAFKSKKHLLHNNK